MKKLLGTLGIVAAFVATAADNNWQVDETGSASGSITNEAHWSSGASASAIQWLSKLPSSTAEKITVTLPDDYVTPATGFRFCAAPGQTLEIEGGDYLMSVPESPYDGTPFGFGLYKDGNWRAIFAAWLKNSSYYSQAVLRWEDARAKLTASETGETVTLDINGTFAYTNNYNEIKFFGSSAIKDATVRFCKGAQFLGKGETFLYGSSDTNRLIFVGGEHAIQDGAPVFFYYGDGWDAAKPGLVEMRLEDEAVLDVPAQNSFYLGAESNGKATTNKTMRIVLTGGSKLKTPKRGIWANRAGTAEVIIDGEGSEYYYDTNFSLPMPSSNAGRAQKISSRLVVTDGGKLNGYGASSILTLGTDDTYGDALDCPSVAAFTNATAIVGGRVDVNCGTLDSVDSALTFTALNVGMTSHATPVAVSGGTLTIRGSAGVVIGKSGVGSLTLADAATMSVVGTVTVGSAAGSDGTFALRDGAVFTGLEIAGGSGASSFVSDGGILAPTAAAANLLHGLSSATITANGLTVESDCDVTIAQSLANATDEQGVLCLRGAGAKTLGGTASDVSRIDVPEGSLVFTDAARFASSVTVTNGASVAFGASATAGTLTGLTLGDAESTATLVLTPNQKIAVTGPVALEHLRVSLLDGFAAGTYAIIEATGAVSAATRTVWTNTLVLDGTPDGLVATFASSEADGTTTFTMTLASVVERRITIPQGTTQTVATVASYDANETLTVDVGDQASATITGKLGTGNLVKEGRGILRLASLENDFFGRLFTWGGLFSVANLTALGYERFGLGSFTLGGGTLELGETDAAEQRFPYELIVNTPSDAAPGVVVKTDSDVVMDVPTMQSGAILKRGAGRLAFEVGSGDHTLTVTNAYGVFNDCGQMQDLVFDDFGNVPTDKPGYTGLNVLEGELLLRGTEPGAQLSSTHTINIGLSPTTGSANPGFVLDNVKLVQSGWGNWFNFACGISTHNPFAQSPYLYVTNNATLQCSLHVSCNSDTRWPRLVPRILVDHSVLKISSMDVSGDWHYPEWTFQNDARFYSSQLRGGARDLIYVFDASICAKNEDLDPLEFYDSYQYYRHGATFRNGSLFCCNNILCDGRGANSCTNVWSFDNSEWRPAKSGDFAFSFPNVWNQLIRVTGTGIILAPPEDATWRMAIPVRGEGGLVKRGAGTLVFDTNEAHGAKVTEDPLTLDCTGTVAVEAGTLRVLAGSARAGLSFDVAEGATLELGSGATLANVTVAGAGTVTGGSLAGLTIVPGTDEAPTFDSALLGGTVSVDFGHTAESPAEPGAYVVAHYTGAAPSLAGWTAKGLGRRGLMATFTAANGGITAKVSLKGLMLIVR